MPNQTKLEKSLAVIVDYVAAKGLIAPRVMHGQSIERVTLLPISTPDGVKLWTETLANNQDISYTILIVTESSNVMYGLTITNIGTLIHLEHIDFVKNIKNVCYKFDVNTDSYDVVEAGLNVTESHHRILQHVSNYVNRKHQQQRG